MLKPKFIIKIGTYAFEVCKMIEYHDNQGMGIL